MFPFHYAHDTTTDRFPEQIAPLAGAIVQRLAETFLQLVALGRDDGDYAFVASQTLETIVCALDATAGTPEIHPQLEAHILPIIHQLLSEDADDCLEYIGACCCFHIWPDASRSPQVNRGYLLTAQLFDVLA